MRKLRAGPLEAEFDRIGAGLEAVVGRPTHSTAEVSARPEAAVIGELSGLAEAFQVTAVEALGDHHVGLASFGPGADHVMGYLIPSSPSTSPEDLESSLG